MVQISLFFVSFILWQENFTESVSAINQLYDYHVTIVHQDGKVRLTANPQFEGFASAWLHVDDKIILHENDALAMRIRGNDIPVCIRYFFRKGKCPSYYAGEKTFFADSEWHEVLIPLESAMSFSGTEFPAALTPGESPVFYLFIENGEPGNFDLEIDRIAILRNDIETEKE